MNTFPLNMIIFGVSTILLKYGKTKLGCAGMGSGLGLTSLDPGGSMDGVSALVPILVDVIPLLF